MTRFDAVAAAMTAVPFPFRPNACNLKAPGQSWRKTTKITAVKMHKRLKIKLNCRTVR
jgi:hypothetical protein